jgi:hypothetical protein
MVRSGDGDSRYRLLYLDRIKEAVIRQEPVKAPAYVYIQTTGSRDIEVVLARESSDLLLVFVLPPEAPVSEYTLIAQTEIFAHRYGE